MEKVTGPYISFGVGVGFVDADRRAYNGRLFLAHMASLFLFSFISLVFVLAFVDFESIHTKRIQITLIMSCVILAALAARGWAIYKQLAFDPWSDVYLLRTPKWAIGVTSNGVIYTSESKVRFNSLKYIVGAETVFCLNYRGFKFHYKLVDQGIGKTHMLVESFLSEVRKLDRALDLSHVLVPLDDWIAVEVDPEIESSLLVCAIDVPDV